MQHHTAGRGRRRNDGAPRPPSRTFLPAPGTTTEGGDRSVLDRLAEIGDNLFRRRQDSAHRLRVEWAPDSLSIVFHLTRARWHDGQRCASDVRHSPISPGSRVRSATALVTNIDSISVRDSPPRSRTQAAHARAVLRSRLPGLHRSRAHFGKHRRRSSGRPKSRDGASDRALPPRDWEPGRGFELVADTLNYVAGRTRPHRVFASPDLNSAVARFSGDADFETAPPREHREARGRQPPSAPSHPSLQYTYWR